MNQNNWFQTLVISDGIVDNEVEKSHKLGGQELRREIDEGNITRFQEHLQNLHYYFFFQKQICCNGHYKNKGKKNT